MKNYLIILVLLISELASGSVDTVKVASTVADVSVFFSGAQVARRSDLKVPAGKHVVLIDKLSREINQQSIQVSGIPGCSILSVKYQLHDLSATEKQPSETALQNKIDTIERKIKIAGNKMNVYDMEEKLLIDNSIIRKKDDGTTVAELREAADFYRARLNEIRQGKLKLTDEIDAANKKTQELYARLNELTAESHKTFGQIMVTIDCQKEISATLKFSYFVPSAGWTPNYDFRVDEITKPLVIVYNANVFQSSGEDWKSVNLRLSTSNPTLSGNKPELMPWYLERGNSHPVEPVKGGFSTLKGRVLDAASGEPIFLANVVVLSGDEQIAGATTNFDGSYLIKPVPSGNYSVKATYLGYKLLIVKNIPLLPGKITFQDFKMNESAVLLESVTVMDYKAPLINEAQTISGGTVTSDEISKLSSRSGDVTVVETIDYISNTLKNNVVNLEYIIDIPYTIPSDGADYSIRIKEAAVPVNYVYDAVPKLDPDVFLTAEIPGWTELNLSSGNAGIYYQGTFTGESFIDTDQPSDTLRVSLGRDRNIIIKREGNKEVNDRRVIGSNVKKTVGWDITVKNNKDCPVRINVADQFPVSEKKSIEVERIESSGGRVDDKSGKITWEILLEPRAKKILNFRYSVKYPRETNIMTE